MNPEIEESNNPKELKRYLIFLVGALLMFSALGGIGYYLNQSSFFKTDSASANGVAPGSVELTWGELVKLDLETGKTTPFLDKVDGELVKLPGYIVPLSDNSTELDEFLFVPNGQACIHVPPPPANLIVKAKLSKKMLIEDVHNPSWITGHLKIQTQESQYGSSSYYIGDAVLYKYDLESE